MAEKTDGATQPTDPAAGSTPSASESGENPGPGAKLFGMGFVSLLATQFFGAANDNILKQCLTFMVATGLWSGDFGKNGLGEGGQVLPALFLTLPFILLSGYAGQISDKFSKQTVMLWVKVAEIPIAIVAFIGFYTHNLWLTLFAMLLLAVQSSFFGPAKYGVIPEIASDDKLSMANGVINMLTNIAVIAGSLMAGPLSDLFYPTKKVVENVEVAGVAGVAAVAEFLPEQAVPWAPGAALVAVAIAGLVSMLFFQNSNRRTQI